MMNIEEQIAWEQECSERGAEVYRQQQASVAAKGRVDQLDSYQFVAKSRLKGVANHLDELLAIRKVGFMSVYAGLLRGVSEHTGTDMIAFFGMQCLMRALADGKRSKGQTLTRVAGKIGDYIEVEMKCRLFEQKNPAYYDVIVRSFKEQMLQSFEHKRAVLYKSFRQYHDIKWNSWDVATKIGVGAKVLEALLLELSDLVLVRHQRKGIKTVALLGTTPAFDAWVKEFDEIKGLMNPAFLPTKIVPLDWDAHGVGGYYTTRMQSRLPMIKTKGRDHAAFCRKYVPHQHIEAINRMQHTAWQINTDILDVANFMYTNNLGHGLPAGAPIRVPEIPEYLKVPKDQYTDEMFEELKFWKIKAKQAYFEEKQRIGKLITMTQTLRTAQEMRDWESLYFVYSCCFRGRIYCATTALSPQGSDLSRALLTFSKQVELGQEGIFWLAVHGASMFGIKGTYTELYNWTMENREWFERIAVAPCTVVEWANADKPYRFLAWVLEWARVGYGNDPKALSGLPVGIDGSCNGLQHFSAILRDKVGAEATNLCIIDETRDIYTEVAKECIKQLQVEFDADANGMAGLWLNVGIDRTTTKRSVMTLPYGATKQACREHVFSWVCDNWDKFHMSKNDRWKVANYFAELLWSCIGKVVVAAFAAMSWLQLNTRTDYLKWVSPVGFPVFQFYKSVKSTRVNTKIAGGTRLTIVDIDKKGGPNSYKQRLGIVPNFIHSVDASHMVMTINHVDLPAYSMIHDEFGTHAGNLSKLYVGTRHTFHHLYSTCDPLEMWAKHQGIVNPELPPKGDYNIDEVLNAPYFFGM